MTPEELKATLERVAPYVFTDTDRAMYDSTTRSAIRTNSEARALTNAREDIPKLIAEIERLQAEKVGDGEHHEQLAAVLASQVKANDEQFAEIERLQAENEQLRKARIQPLCGKVLPNAQEFGPLYCTRTRGHDGECLDVIYD